MFKSLNDANIEFLLDRSGEVIDNAEIPKEVLAWVDNESFMHKETGYVAKLNDTYGFMYIEEYEHNNQTISTNEELVEKRGLTEEKVLEALKKQATKVAEKLPEDMFVFVGEKTGFGQTHEMLIFFPYKTSTETYEQVLESINGEREPFLTY